MRFVNLKVRNPPRCIVLSGTLYVLIHFPGLRDLEGIDLINLGTKRKMPFQILEALNSQTVLKSSQNKKDLNDVTAAPFRFFFLLEATEKKTPKMGQL